MTAADHSWYTICFRIIGDLHVGARKWGFVRSGRAYLPGWTLWGALTNFLKSTGKRPGTFEEVGRWLNTHFWIGHSTLMTRLPDTEEGTLFAFIPVVRMPNHRTVFQWQAIGVPQPPPERCPAQPMAYRHGVVRQPALDEGTLGNLFLTETISSPRNNPFFLQGWIMAAAGERLPLSLGDCLPIGGSRTAGGASLVLEGFEEQADLRDLPDGLSHLRCPEGGGVAGTLERIVLRRTLENDPRGFGGKIVDWGLHLRPGWQSGPQHVLSVRPFRDQEKGWLHGTVTLELPVTG